jgi:hypothetical protein
VPDAGIGAVEEPHRRPRERREAIQQRHASGRRAAVAHFVALVMTDTVGAPGLDRSAARESG